MCSLTRGIFLLCGSNSVGRVTAFQAVGRGFESRLPLCQEKGTCKAELVVPIEDREVPSPAPAKRGEPEMYCWFSRMGFEGSPVIMS